MLICMFGLLFVASYLPLSSGQPDVEKNEAFCSSNTCYTAHLTKVKFADAAKGCVDKGGDLVTMKTEEEARLVYNLLWKLTNNTIIIPQLKLWIGLHLKKGSCVKNHKTLKGFSWSTTADEKEESKFSNWKSDPKQTCLLEKCVRMMLDVNSPDNFKWDDDSCSSLLGGYICKFKFQGMCPPVVLAGPGTVEYETPIGFKSPSLALFPHGSLVYVSCHQQQSQTHMLFCKDVKESGTTLYQWSTNNPDRSHGPLCVSEKLGCSHNNGGCEHECVETQQKGAISCKCRKGYVLASDLVSCILPDHCQNSNCAQTCINHQHGFKCTCPTGFVLDEDEVNCRDIDECLASPCNQTCKNTEGSFQCHCHVGYTKQGTQCVDIDECINSPCSQNCLNIRGSYLCSCKIGYALSSDKTNCVDVDECTNSPCAHGCHNTPGSYICTCPEGFLLSSDQISCIPEPRDPKMGPDSPGIKDAEPRQSETTMSSQRDMTNQPTPSSVATDTFTVKVIKEQMSLSTLVSHTESSSPSNESMDLVISDGQDGYSIVLLISILCACAVVLILLVIAGGVLCYRKKNAKNKDAEKRPSAADNYCWVPESEKKAINNDFR
ncbi:complement component C1q receptor [Hyperolius riggenbachi]|uniref:complement component C1q receptor n=1 Tax=Hyperolius riggenbachi TaxID=752182 RepID=UPI0035A359B1